MKKTVLVIVSALIVMAISGTPVFAEKPVEMTLTGTFFIVGMGDNYLVAAGESDNYLIKIRNAPTIWTGDIAGSGTTDGNWVVKGGPLGRGELANTVGRYYLPDVTVAGIGTGDLFLGYSELEYWIESGSGDLRSIRGKGTATQVNFVTYNYELVIQINPFPND